MLSSFKCPRRNRRKFARCVYRASGVLKGLFIGLLVGALFTAAGMSHAASSCGGTSQPRCEVNVSLDAETSSIAESVKDQIRTALDDGKGKLADIPSGKFDWTFIPQIPTAECVNPQIPNPLGGSAVEMDVCSPFNKFQKFINGVLAFFCLLGCAQQIKSAMAVKG